MISPDFLSPSRLGPPSRDGTCCDSGVRSGMPLSSEPQGENGIRQLESRMQPSIIHMTGGECVQSTRVAVMSGRFHNSYIPSKPSNSQCWPLLDPEWSARSTRSGASFTGPFDVTTLHRMSLIYRSFSSKTCLCLETQVICRNRFMAQSGNQGGVKCGTSDDEHHFTLSLSFQEHVIRHLPRALPGYEEEVSANAFL